jgi:hypothetical protein
MLQSYGAMEVNLIIHIFRASIKIRIIVSIVWNNLTRENELEFFRVTRLIGFMINQMVSFLV